MMVTRHELTARIALPALLGVGLVALAVLTGNRGFLLLAGAAGGLLVAALVVRPRLDDLAVTVPGAARAAVGDAVHHTVRVRNQGRRTSPGVVITHAIAGLDPVTVYVDPLPPGGQAQVALVRPAVRRGTTGLSRVVVESTAPLGLLRSQRVRDQAQLLVVHPARVAPDRLAQPGGATDEAVDPRAGAGLDLAGVRDYRPGDDPRHVHWRSTARRGHLVVTERGHGPAEELDLLVVGPSAAPDWEALVAVAAATAHAAQQAGRPVAVAAWAGLGPGLPAPTASPLELLDWWAGLDLAELPDPAALLARRTRSRTGLVLAASAHVPPGWWPAVQAAALATGTDVALLVAP